MKAAGLWIWLHGHPGNIWHEHVNNNHNNKESYFISKLQNMLKRTNAQDIYKNCNLVVAMAFSVQLNFSFNALLTFLYPNISMHILHTVLYTFLMVLTRRICLTISLHILHTVLHTFPKSLTRIICLTISLHILHTVLHTFLMVLIRRIRPTIKNSSSW